MNSLCAYSCLGCGKLLTDLDACAMSQGLVIGSAPDPRSVLIGLYGSTLASKPEWPSWLEECISRFNRGGGKVVSRYEGKP